jgi:hypothetical protein
MKGATMGGARPVCVTGMHRSGTSMIANALRQAGLDLGPESEMVATRLGNSEGHWEHRRFVALNDELLARLGGWWAVPPPAEALGRAATLSAQRAKARRLLGEFEGRAWWGWKDPRNCLTLPFWLDLLPDLRVVVCLRHPLEVTRSLERRSGDVFRTNWPRVSASRAGTRLWRALDRATGGLGLRPRNFFPAEHWLALWETYNRCVLEFTRPGQRLVTHYDSYFTRPREEFARVLDFLGVEGPAEAAGRCSPVVSGGLRHEWLTAREPGGAGARELYARLCAESGVSS